MVAWWWIWVAAVGGLLLGHWIGAGLADARRECPPREAEAALRGERGRSGGDGG